MNDTIRWCVFEWRRDLNHWQYGKVVVETWEVADYLYGENDEEWIEALKSVIKKLDELSDRMIMPHIRKYLKDFLNVAIRAVKGKCEKQELTEKKEETLELLSIAYST